MGQKWKWEPSLETIARILVKTSGVLGQCGVSRSSKSGQIVDTFSRKSHRVCLLPFVPRNIVSDFCRQNII